MKKSKPQKERLNWGDIKPYTRIIPDKRYQKTKKMKEREANGRT